MGSVNIFILIWKNFKIQIRHPWRTALGILLIVVLMIMLIVLRLTASIESKEIETVFSSYDIDSLPLEEYNVTETLYLFYAPQSSFLEQIMTEVASYLNVTSIGFQSEEKMISAYHKSTTKVVAGIVFFSNLKDGLKFSGPISYKICPKNIPGVSWNITKISPDFPRPELYEKSQYGTYYRDYGFLTIQNAVSKTLFQNLIVNFNQEFDDVFEIRMRRLPYPPYEFDSFYRYIEYIIAIAIGLGFLLPSAFIAKDIVHERETKLKQTLKLIGISNWQIWLAWFIKWFISLFILNLIITAMLCIRFSGPAVLNNSNTSLILLWMVMFSVAVIAFSFFISTFFIKDNSASAAAGILFIITFLPYIHSRGLFHQLPLAFRIIFCLLPNTLFSYSLRIIVRLELIGKGLQWDNLDNTESIDVEMSMNTVFEMFLIDIVFYFILTWYIEVMRPDSYQRKYPWYFPVMATYWTGHFSVPSQSTESKCLLGNPECFEKDLPRVKPIIDIKNLTKVYDGASKPVIDNVDLKAYKGQITALLGHTCSGKSTFASMLYGAQTPTSGIIGLKGYNMCKHSDVRKILPLLSICPEYDVSIDDLNIEENLYFFCRFKGYDTKAVNAEISHILGILDLEIKKNRLVSSLSPDDKRRISIGIALIGGPEIVILDEPTSRMDSDIRRIIWDVLIQEKRGKAIFLTTSRIKEANALADRIAVIHNGCLICCGSPLFLKKKYGAGYHVTITKSEEGTAAIKNLVFSKIPDAIQISDSENEIRFTLPHDCRHLYSELFNELEEKELGGIEMMVSETSLDYFFNRIVNESCNSNASTSQNFPKNAVTLPSYQKLVRQRNEGCTLFCQHSAAVLIKRLIFSRRNALLTASQILVLPIIIVFSNLIKDGTLAYSKKKLQKSLFTLEAYRGTYVTYGIDPSSNFTIDLGDTYASLLGSSETLYMVDLDEENFLKYLLDQAIKDAILYKTKYIIGAVFMNDYNKTLITAFYNPEMYHSAATSLLYVYNAILSYYTKEQSISFHILNEPLPYRHAEYNLLANEYDLDLAFFWAQDLLIGMSILMSSFVIILVIENSTKAKKQQIISGLNAFTYWFSSFIYDFGMYTIPCILMLVVLSVFETECLSGGAEIGSLALLLILHGLSALSFIYCCAFCSRSSSAAYLGVFLYYFLGLCILYIIFLFEVSQVYYVSEILDIVFTVLMPSYCVGRGIYNIFKNCIGNLICNSEYVQIMCLNRNSTYPVAVSCCSNICGDSCIFWDVNPLSLSTSGIGKQLIVLAVHPFIFFTLLTLLEMKLFQSQKKKKKHLKSLAETYTDTDISVLEETKRVISMPLSQLIYTDHYLILKEASKFINSYFSIGKLSFALKKGECFGLIGLERSGKSTLLRMIAASTPLTTGTIHVDGINIAVYPHKVQDKIGFSFGCSALLEQLTVEETLILYAQLRGIPAKEIPYFVEFFIRTLLLKPDVLVKHCNCTDQRKLSVAVTIMGTPPLILVDEPTSEMDPSSCIHVEEVIKLPIYLGCTTILATQKIEESEAFCNCIGIMVKGKLNYIGDLNNLRKQFEDGYTLILTFQKSQKSRSKLTSHAFSIKGNLEEIKGLIEDVLPKAILKMEYLSYLNYYIPNRQVRWSKLFRLLEKMKFQELLYDYSIFETTLEEMFSYITYISDTKEKKIAEFLKERKTARF